MRPLVNLHTHSPRQSEKEIIVMDSPVGLAVSEPYYSISLHPWFLNEDILQRTVFYLEQHSNDKNLVAIGECGLDKLCLTPIELQIKSFEIIAQLATQYNKPLIIHCVKAFNELIQIKQKIKPQQAWIIHGFRGNPTLAQQLIKQGFCLSFGPKYNRETIKVIPLGAIFTETDDSDINIAEVYRSIACDLDISVDILTEIVHNNLIKNLNITI